MNWLKGWFDPPHHSTEFHNCWKRLPIVLVVKILQFTPIQTTYRLYYTSKGIYKYGFIFLQKQINEYKRLSNAHRFMYFMYKHKHRCFVTIQINNSYFCTNFMRFRTPKNCQYVVFYNLSDDAVYGIFAFNDYVSIFGFKEKDSGDVKMSFRVIGMTWFNVNEHVIRINVLV